MKYLLATLALLLYSAGASAQTDNETGIIGMDDKDMTDAGYRAKVPANRFVEHATTFGIGTNNVLDTYLSPYNYKGTEVRVTRETMRMTTLMHGNVAVQTLVDGSVAYLDNRAKTANEWAGGIRYSIGWLYNFRSNVKDLGLAAGLQPSGYIGGIYNTRNGNNPAQAKADVTINATAMLKYSLRIGRHTLPVRYQITIPVIGMAFSQQYGQSYYETFSLGDYDHNVCFAYIGNMPSMRNTLSVDIPIKQHTIRVGCVLDFNQSTFNNLRYHSYSTDFMIGWSKKFYRL